MSFPVFDMRLTERVGAVSRTRQVSVPVPRWARWACAVILVEIGGTLALMLYMLACGIAHKHGWL